MFITAQLSPGPALRCFALCLALGTSSAALAQADEPWEGTYNGNVGVVRLVQDGDRVFGDYETKRGNFGIIEARVSSDGMTMRGTYQNLKAKTDNALLEFRLTDAGFTGSWTQFHNMRTVSWEGARWVSEIVSTQEPQLKYASAQGLNYAERFPGTVSRLRRWAMFDQGTDVSQTVLWDERGYTGLRDQAVVFDAGPRGAALARGQQTLRPGVAAPKITRDRNGNLIGNQPRLPEGFKDTRSFPGEMHQPGDGGEEAFPGEMHSPAGNDGCTCPTEGGQ